jgi:hypothetical protein
LYKAIWGKDPDSYQGAAGNPFAVSAAQGAEGAFTRICQSQTIRTDLTFGPGVQALQSGLARIEDTAGLHAEMTRVLAVFESAFQGTPLSRVAVYLQLGQEAPDIREANKALLPAIWQTNQIALTDEEDFILQFNRPRLDPSDPTIKLNFITKWSVERLQVLTFLGQSPPGGVGVAAPSVPVVSEKVVPTVAFDNSNVPLQRPFNPDEAARVLSELFAEFAFQLKVCNITIRGF